MAHTKETRAREWKKRMAKRAAFFFGKVCVKCGSNENLELDHIDPKTKISHTVWSWRKERMEEELKKCQVLCEVCHLEKSTEEQRAKVQPIRHGTETGYLARKCRCDECRLARRAARAIRKKIRGHW